MITSAWEVGDLVITGLLLALTAGVVAAGLLGAAVGNAGVWAWRRLYGRWRHAQASDAPPEPRPPDSPSQARTGPAKPHAPA